MAATFWQRSLRDSPAERNDWPVERNDERTPIEGKKRQNEICDMRNLLTVADLKSAEIDRIFAITEDLKTKYAAGRRDAHGRRRGRKRATRRPSARVSPPARA